MSGGNLLARYENYFSSHTQLSVQTYWDRTVRTGTILDETRDTLDFDAQLRLQPLEDRNALLILMERFP